MPPLPSHVSMYSIYVLYLCEEPRAACAPFHSLVCIFLVKCTVATRAVAATHHCLYFGHYTHLPSHPLSHTPTHTNAHAIRNNLPITNISLCPYTLVYTNKHTHTSNSTLFFTSIHFWHDTSITQKHTLPSTYLGPLHAISSRHTTSPHIQGGNRFTKMYKHDFSLWELTLWHR